MKKTSCLIFAALILAVPVFAQQTGTTESKLSEYMNKVRTSALKYTVEENNTLKGILNEDPDVLLKSLQKHEADTDHRVRSKAFSLEWTVVQKMGSDEAMRPLVTRMVRACAGDPDRNIRDYIARLMARSSSDYFNEESKQIIRDATANNCKDSRILILCGVAGLKDQIPTLRKLLVDETKLDRATGRYGTSWYARLALARMGSKDDTAQCIKVVDAEKDSVFRVGVLLNHLAFTRQQEVISVLRSELMSEERLPSAMDFSQPSDNQNDSNTGTSVSSYALNTLARTVEGFPVRYKGYIAYDIDELKTAREWMNQHKEITFKKTVSFGDPFVWN